MTQEAKRTLIFAFLKFLRDELKQENINADLKESLEGQWLDSIDQKAAICLVKF